VGLPGDRVKRYGQYVHLYVPQDPVNFGLVYPEHYKQEYTWMDKDWDKQTKNNNNPLQESQRTITVPNDHVWLEADCPGLGLDSRQFGPIPVEWLRGYILGRVWPLWSHPDHRQRPHPIPLDDESLKEHNVFRIRARKNDEVEQCTATDASEHKE